MFGIVFMCGYCRHTGRNIHAINMGSYNYLGFANKTGPCADAATEATLKYGLGTCSPRHELGTVLLSQSDFGF